MNSKLTSKEREILIGICNSEVPEVSARTRNALIEKGLANISGGCLVPTESGRCALGEDRTEYRQAHGLADWWQKDGMWHIALPYPDPCPETGLRTGGYRYTDATFRTRVEAIAALEEAHLTTP